MGKNEADAAGLRTGADEMLGFKAQVRKFTGSGTCRKESLLSLTPFGQEIVKNSGLGEIFEKEKDLLVETLETRYDPGTKYDVQETSRIFMDEKTDYEPFQPIKKYAYDNAVDFGQILRAGAIPLRDYYLEKHPEIEN